MKKFEREWQGRFQRFARYKEEHFVSGWSEHGLRRRLSSFKMVIDKLNISAPVTVLDLGCGAGTYVRFLSTCGYTVVGLDYSFQSLQRAQVLDRDCNGCYIGGEAYRLPFRQSCFDMVTSIGVLQTLTSPEEAIDEIIRVLKPGGVVIIDFLNAYELVALTVSALERLRGQTPRVRTYTPSEVCQWFETRGLHVKGREGIFLPPRQLPWLSRVIDSKESVYLRERIPFLSLVGAHAFLLIGKKKNA